MKKLIVSSLFLTALFVTLLFTPASYAGPNVFINLGPYGAVGYPAGYIYPVNNGCCGACAYSNPAGVYYSPYYNNPYAVGNQALNNPYVFDTTNINNVGRIAPVHMNPRNPYGY